MFGNSHYSFKHYTNISDILEDHANYFKSLIGRRLLDIWIVWDLEDNEWFNDGPVVICFEDSQLELSAYKSDEFIISLNEIPLSQDINWYGTNLKLKWEKRKLPALTCLTNKLVKHVEIIEVFEGDTGAFPSLFGIGFQLEDQYFAVCNGFDENMILTERKTDMNYKYTII